MMAVRFASLGREEKLALSEYPLTRWRCLNDLVAAKIAALSFQAPEQESTSQGKPSEMCVESGDDSQGFTFTHTS